MGKKQREEMLGFRITSSHAKNIITPSLRASNPFEALPPLPWLRRARYLSAPNPPSRSSLAAMQTKNESSRTFPAHSRRPGGRGHPSPTSHHTRVRGYEHGPWQRKRCK